MASFLLCLNFDSTSVKNSAFPAAPGKGECFLFLYPQASKEYLKHIYTLIPIPSVQSLYYSSIPRPSTLSAVVLAKASTTLSLPLL